MRVIALLPVLFLLAAVVVLVWGVLLVVRRKNGRQLLVVAAVCAGALVAAGWYSSSTVVINNVQCMAPMAVDDVFNGPSMATADVPIEERLECRARARAIVGGWTIAGVAAAAGFAWGVRRTRQGDTARASVSTV